MRIIFPQQFDRNGYLITKQKRKIAWMSRAFNLYDFQIDEIFFQGNSTIRDTIDGMFKCSTCFTILHGEMAHKYDEYFTVYGRRLCRATRIPWLLSDGI